MFRFPRTSLGKLQLHDIPLHLQFPLVQRVDLNLGPLTGQDVEFTQLANANALQPQHRRNQNVSALLDRDVRVDQPKVLPFQPQVPASTSVKLR